MLTIFELIIFWLIFDGPYMLYRSLLFFAYNRKITALSKPRATILIPAYNEELSIEKTLRSCIHQSYPNLEIIVINDGSKDSTAEIVKNFILHHRHKNIRLINQENQGKARALNNGLKKANSEFLITIDADSYLHHKSVELLMAKFKSKKVGAVAGNIVALSRHKLLGYIQKMEYEISTHFLRESQSALGAVTVTPGAFSGYRRSALIKFEEGTLTEDFDSSAKVLDRGYEIIIAVDALCYTQVPLNIIDIIKQRIRWQQGGIEVFSKHLFENKRFLVSLEMFLIFFYGFYGLFPKILTFLILPLNLYSFNISTFLFGLLIFLIYFTLIWSIKLAVIGMKDIGYYLIVPLFLIYWYTIILYSILAAQIMVFKKNKRWGTLQRYRM
ncbi:MAG: glycosyltransferase [Nanoarchaeota archaeon]|nr:glycosyltransferase [Nanoarchaeota archaeon]